MVQVDLGTLESLKQMNDVQLSIRNDKGIAEIEIDVKKNNQVKYIEKDEPEQMESQRAKEMTDTSFDNLEYNALKEVLYEEETEEGTKNIYIDTKTKE